ncbi:IclR family transcriptional regulator [Bacillus sp. 03113]|uniref:IclR family transcriptional regulator n=1 Tax=Bacillus sp. 03113 TaxID=2578211 RepID=UPI0011451BB1|nr:IclR family transcriptional regulator [Bacillus sp. 03113]
MQSKNKTVIKSMTVLNLFLNHSKLSLSEIIQISGLPKTSVHRMLSSLEDMQLLDKDEDGKYSLGLLFLQFGQLVAERLDIRKIALPVMKELRDEVGEAVNLIVKYGNEGMYIEKQDTTQPVRLYTAIGRKSPLHAGDSRIILAFLPEEQQEAYINSIQLIQYGLGSIMDKDKLRYILIENRKKGYSISKSELENYTTAIAAPILNYNGEIVAGLSIAGPDVRITEERTPYLVEKVISAASEVSKKLGYLQ